MRRLLLTFLLLALAACSGAETDDSAAPTGSEEAALGRTPPLLLWLGYYHDAGSLVLSSTTYRLLETGAENVMITQGMEGPDPKFAEWQRRGGKMSFHMPRKFGTRGDALETHLAKGDEAEGVADAAATIEALFAHYAYVTIDELNDVAEPDVPGSKAPNLRWRNGAPLAVRFEKLLEKLAVDGFDRRVILYVNSYDMVGRFHLYGDVIRACGRHCRVLASEIYLSTGSVMSRRRLSEAPGHCDRNLSCFASIAEEMHRAAPGINTRTITVLGLSDDYTEKKTSAFCAGDGSLARQLAALHAAGSITRQQPGVGGYAPYHVTFGQAAQAECIAVHAHAATWPAAGPGSPAQP